MANAVMFLVGCANLVAMLLFTNLSVQGSFATTLLIPEIAVGFGIGTAPVLLRALADALALPGRPRRPLSPEPHPIEVAA